MREVLLSPDALGQLRKLPARVRAKLKDRMRSRLRHEDALLEDKNRFRLRRPSSVADFELRVDDLRVFYRVRANQVEVVLIGEKDRDRLLIGGKEFTL